MAKRIDAVALREIRLSLSEKYLKSRDEELKELRDKFGHLRKVKGTSKSR